MKKIILLVAIINIIFANVSVKVNKNEIMQGEKVIFTITADGKNVKLPDIDKIGPYRIIGTSNSENIVVINGELHSSVSRSYIFAPLKDITIPSFKVVVDGKVYYTKPIKIKVDKLKKTNDKNYDLTIYLDKNKTYLGEGRVLTIKFSQSLDANPQSIQIERPVVDSFLIKQIDANEYVKGNRKISEYRFLIIPQKSGKFKIGPFIANIGILNNESPFDNPFFSSSMINYKKIISNEVELNVEPIPQNSIYGNFKIELKSDKTEAMANTPIKIELKITGCGDFYDLKDFKLPLKNATVYEKKPIIKTYIKNNQLCGEYIKEFDVIAQNDINISGISLLEFNGSLNYIKSNPLFIKIDNPKRNSSKVENFSSPKIVYVEKNNYNYLFIFLAFIGGIVIGFLIKNFRIKKVKKDELFDLLDRIKRVDDRELFKLLLPYSDNKEIEEILRKIEGNIYKGEKNKIDRKKIIEIIKSIK